jgi:DNA polymerase-3 subunit alpha
MSSFVHLHTHSEYSTLDGASKIAALVDKAISDGMKALAITDHGNMYGAKEFFNYVRKKNAPYDSEISKLQKQIIALQETLEDKHEEEIATLQAEIKKQEEKKFKPILGCEAYVAAAHRDDKKTKEDASGDHLVLLAKNKTGYHNLIKMVSLGFTEGFYYKPRIDKELLEKYHEGIIVSSACLGGEIPQLILNGKLKEAENTVLWFKQLFGEDFYLEVQRHQTTDPTAAQDVFQHQKEVNPRIIDLAKKHGIKVIATNDAHFVNEEEAEAHDRLLCINTNSDVKDPNRMRYTKQEWFKTQDEMAKIFTDIPEVLTNTLEIADKVAFYDLNNTAVMPDFPLPDEFSSADDYLAHLTMEGAKRLYQEPVSEEVLERINFELATIKNMGFAGYFLIVQDFIWAGKRMGVTVGPGRGSAAGSVVAYCLGITDIDPLKYNLLFERFLNPDRISMPDIDIDFDDDGRALVLKYVEEKYGKEKVARIITFGTMAAKSAIKDVARVQQVPLSEAEKLSKLIDEIPRDRKATIAAAIECVPEMQKAINSTNPLITDTIKYAQMLEGTVRNVGVHACGIIICRDDLTEHVPICTATDKETGENMLVTQYEGTLIEDVGMIKMDFLGLKTLSIIKEALDNIEQSTGNRINIDTIPIDDPKTYELYSNGQTIGTFQFESDGMRQHLRNLKPTKFEDLIAMNALYRPGPMDYIPDFIDRKHGRKKIEYDLPEMEEYLDDTYGITVYQEQVMLLSRKLANFSRGESDELRKAMGKKIIEKMKALKEKFLAGCKENGHDSKICEKIWADWERFAAYAFNKSHATCYSWIAYQTAYLKANYPAEYMAAVLSRNKDNITEITKFMDECRNMGVQVLGPDVNESNLKFTVNKAGDIRFGLGAIKGVGENAVIAIMEERKKKGAFTSIFDFVERINLSTCNRKTMESLALAGAFDNLKEIKREQFFAQNSKGEIVLDTIIRYGNKRQTDKAVVSNSLFGEDEAIEIAKPEIPQTEEWSTLERLNKEREVVGIYLSAHPLDEFYVELNYLCNTSIAEFKDIEQLKKKKLIKAGGIVTSFRSGMTKKGNQFGAITIEDFSGANEFMLFGSDFVDYSKFQKKDLYVFIQGEVENRRSWDKTTNTNPVEEFKIKKMGLLGDLSKEPIEKLILTLDVSSIDKEFVDEISAKVPENKGKTKLILKVIDKKNHFHVELFARGFQINVSKNLIFFLQQKQEQLKLINFDLVLPNKIT